MTKMLVLPEQGELKQWSTVCNLTQMYWSSFLVPRLSLCPTSLTASDESQVYKSLGTHIFIVHVVHHTTEPG